MAIWGGKAVENFAVPMVAGVVVETGGDLSHGSIILREIGLPAITNAHRATVSFRSGDKIWLRAGAGTAECLASSASTSLSDESPA